MNSLFRYKVYPIVETVEDIIDNKEIRVYTTLKRKNFEHFNETLPNIYDKLISKLNEDKIYFEKTNVEKDKMFTIKGISKGKYVELGNEGFTQNTRHQYSGKFPNLYISDHKYDYKPLALIVGRKHRYSQEILALYVSYMTKGIS